MVGNRNSHPSFRHEDVRHDDSRATNKMVLGRWSTRIVVFCVAVLCFANSYDGEFVFDDSEAIENNKDLLPSTPMENLLGHDFWGRKLSNLSHKSYRPLTVLTFRWNYWAAGGLNPKGFHVVNILLHGLLSVLFLPFFSLLLEGSTESAASSEYGVSLWSFLCSILFAVHPVHTESVAGVVGRADLLCALFFILSFLLYAKGSTTYNSFRPESFSLSWLCLSFICSGLATFSKEQGITVIGVCSAYDILSICGVNITLRKPQSSSLQSSLANGASSKKDTGFSQWKVSFIKRQLLLTATAGLLLVIRWRVMGSAPPTFQVHDNPHSFVEGSVFRALNYSYLYAINAWLLLAPVWLCFDWSMGCVPTITSLEDPRLIVVALFWVMLFLLCWTCLNADSPADRRGVTLALVLIIIPFLPATNLLFRVGFVVAERILYIPSTGFCLLVVLGLQRICRSDKLRTVAIMMFSVLVLVFVIRSVQRSNEWRKGIWLFRAGEKVCPLNAKVHYNIGKLSGDKGDNTEAVERYRLAIQLNPDYDQAMNNLANILKDQGHDQEAERLLDKAATISPDFAAAWMNRGIVKASLKKYEEAEHSYRQGIRCRRNYPDCYYNLGNLNVLCLLCRECSMPDPQYIEMNRSQDALDAFRNATSLKPTHWNSWNNAIVLLDNLKLHDQATKLAHQALKVLPDNSAILSSLASAYGKQDKFVESEKWFLAALMRSPDNPNTHLNLGVLYHRWGKYKEAKVSYQRSLQLDPSNTVTQENMRLLKAKITQT